MNSIDLNRILEKNSNMYACSNSCKIIAAEFKDLIDSFVKPEVSSEQLKQFTQRLRFFMNKHFNVGSTVSVDWGENKKTAFVYINDETEMFIINAMLNLIANPN